MSALAVGFGFLEVSTSEHFYIFLAGGLFGNFCVTCNKVACGDTRFADSILCTFRK